MNAQPRVNRKVLAAYVVLCALDALVLLSAAPRGFACHSPSKRDVAQALASRFVVEAYAIWLVAHHDEGCPASIDELVPYTNAMTADDPWGRPFEMRCWIDSAPWRVRLAVTSLGEDGQRGTEDDLTSAH